ncbi:GDSL esterase/lipase [Zostera marina]|uniref:GDSL esterase/lipase n=1 Tax=Zostera marina TaxID=29655 RepID=A0A0K9P7T2_ZOSMR|nr:GDSL esterase/lipase [Zostera marina]
MPVDSYLLFFFIIFLFIFNPTSTSAGGEESTVCENVTAIFAFGDSTVDPGNNNFLPTTFRSNFPPYGKDFFRHKPTGRFTNGKLPTDFAASYLGIKDHLPPYLDLSLGKEELMTGVSFASAGSGFDPLTAQFSGVVPVLLQVGFFETYKARLELMIGEDQTVRLIEQSVFMVSAGTNDFVTNYFALSLRKKEFTVEQYQLFLLQNIKIFLKILQSFGAKKIVVVGLPPMGCLPVIITLNWKGRFQERDCITSFNSISKDYNSKLKEEMIIYSKYFGDDISITYADIYDPFIDVISSPKKYGTFCLNISHKIIVSTYLLYLAFNGLFHQSGFRETMSGCCGTGLVEASFLCNLHSLICPNTSQYVFWDSIHPTEKAYKIIFNSLRPSINRACK